MASLSYLKILIVDDTAQMRSIVGSVLRGFGVTEIREAIDAPDAFARARGWPPDIIITDLQMGCSDGLDFTRAVRRGENRIDPETPIILMTGHSELARVEEARDAGVNEFLAKPLSVAALLSRIAAVIDRPRPFVIAASYRGPDRRRGARPDYQGPFRRRCDDDCFDIDDFRLASIGGERG